MAYIFNFFTSISSVFSALFLDIFELSVSACYVIAFVLVVRLLMKKAPKVCSYILWGVVFLKLIFPFNIPTQNFTLMPQNEIDTIYHQYVADTGLDINNGALDVWVAPDIDGNGHVAGGRTLDFGFWASKLWIIVIVAVVIYTVLSLWQIHKKLKSAYNLKDNVYICENISYPFVLGIISPKIYLPAGLTNTEQNYVVTHENVHICRGDHIVKLFAFAITCIHWFNPLVWLSFLLMEKDMEMSCDEKVLQILGNEHKKDYSYCILSLATNRRFVPKAYLSFGDSDTKKRVNNVLNYKKPAFWIGVAAVITVIAVAVGMFSKTENIQLPFKNENPTDNYHLTIDNIDTSVIFNLPDEWYFSMRGEDINSLDCDYLCVHDPEAFVYDIYNENDINVGAFAVNRYIEYDDAKHRPIAIYGSVALANMYNFNVLENETNDGIAPYVVVSEHDSGTTATTSVYQSPSLVHNNGGLGDAIYNKGILSHNSDSLIMTAFEFDKDSISDETLNKIAKSIEIKRTNFLFETVNVEFPVSYAEKTEHNTKIFDIRPFRVSISLPSGWTLDTPSENDVMYQLIGAWNRIGIYDENGKFIGAMGYNVYDDPSYTEPMAIFNQIALGNNYQFAVGSSKYEEIITVDDSIAAVVPVYLSYNLANDMGLEVFEGESINNKGILVRDNSMGVYIAIELDRSVYDSIVREIARRIVLSEVHHASKLEISEFATDNDIIDVLYNIAYTYDFSAGEIKKLYTNRASTYFLSYGLYAEGNPEHIENVLRMFIDGKTEEEVRDFAKAELYAGGMSDEVLKSFTHQSFPPVEVYCMTEETINDYLTEWRTPQPRLLAYEDLAGMMMEKYKNNEISFNSNFNQIPEDFIFPEVIMWDSRNIYQNEMGYFVVPIASAVGDNVMYVVINDNEYLSATEKNIDLEPFVYSVTFKKPNIRQWKLSVSCAKKSTDENYIITYCDEKVIPQNSVLYLTNTNNFDIAAHLIAKGRETKIDIPANSTTAVYSVVQGTEYTVGLHADVEENTEIHLTVFEIL